MSRIAKTVFACVVAAGLAGAAVAAPAPGAAKLTPAEKTALKQAISSCKSEAKGNPRHVTEAALAGSHIATLPYKVFQQMLSHPLTDKGIVQFKKDWEAAREAMAANAKAR